VVVAEEFVVLVLQMHSCFLKRKGESCRMQRSTERMIGSFRGITPHIIISLTLEIHAVSLFHCSSVVACSCVACSLFGSLLWAARWPQQLPATILLRITQVLRLIIVQDNCSG